MRVDYQGTDTEKTYGSNRIKAFLSMTPQEVENYIENNVNNLAEAKDTLKTLGMLLRAVAEEVKKNRN